MDVIALVEAGFSSAVAPLGTAVTETQLQLMWRISDEPVIALDGDTAGVRAAQRVVDLALPLLEAGKSLRFAVMPQGQDPDDLLKAGGPAAMKKLLDEAKPMVDLLWEREVSGKNLDSPERKAALDKSLRETIKLIKDPSIRSHYAQALKEMRWQLFKPVNQGQKFAQRGAPKTVLPNVSTKSSSLAIGSETSHILRQSVILASLLKTPEALEAVEGRLGDLKFNKPEHRIIQQFLLEYSGSADLMWTAANEKLGSAVLKTLFQGPHVAIAPGVRNAGDVDFVVTCLLQEFGQMFAIDAHGREVADAVQDLSDLDDEGLTWRLHQSANQLHEATKGTQEDKTEYKTAKNGLRLKEEERKALENLLDQIDFTKPGQR